MSEASLAQKVELMMERKEIICHIGSAMLLRYGFDHSILDDLVQETYARTLPKLDSIRSVEKVPAYTDKVARSVAREWIRKRKEEISIEDAPEPIDPKTPIDILMVTEEERELVYAAIEFLKPKPREAVRARLNGDTFAEIAKRLKIKETTARSYIHRSTPRLQKLIKEHGRALISMAREEREQRLKRERSAGKKGSRS
ncbi:MAG: RNA polymerase sigma factor [Candidatus Poribacteria bacterium]|nr:RNA polymerase sigma factor [Candidatus Poribacteria bacterium]